MIGLKIDDTVKRETKYITYVSVILSVLMNAVYLVVGFWSYRVLISNILSLIVAVTNFLLLGITLQKAVNNEENSKKIIQFSHVMRTFLLFVTAVLGVLLPCFDTAAALIPLFFPRIAILLMPFLHKEK